ncbi:MAG: hypothetical protein WCE90_01705 [Candidatus Zixiibacteriota bacterium]
MAISEELKYADLEELYIDPLNPRLGRGDVAEDISQAKVLELMKDWTLDELAVSFLESGGFWTQEALLVTKEKLKGKERLVVIEGNRRLAALKYLKDALEGNPASPRWKEIARGAKPPKDLFTRIPYILVDSRKDIESFLGFRHVTGIKEWKPAEKAEFIARLIDDRGFSYEEVRRKIGSKTPTVRQNYISYRMLLQIKDSDQQIPKENFEERFSVMFLSLREKGVQKFLQIAIMAEPKKAQKPVPRTHLKALGNFALWLFGDENREPLFTDSRQVTKFGRILESRDALEYLERTENPNFEVAHQLAGGDEPEIAKQLEKAADNIEVSLTRVHLYKKSKDIRKAVSRLVADSMQLFEIFPDIKTQVEKDRM